MGGSLFYSANNTVMVHIRNLRRKLEADPKNQSLLSNVWGKGYRIGKSRRISRLGTEFTLAAVASALVSLALYGP